MNEVGLTVSNEAQSGLESDLHFTYDKPYEMSVPLDLNSEKTYFNLQFCYNLTTDYDSDYAELAVKFLIRMKSYPFTKVSQSFTIYLNNS